MFTIEQREQFAKDMMDILDSRIVMDVRYAKHYDRITLVSVTLSKSPFKLTIMFGARYYDGKPDVTQTLSDAYVEPTTTFAYAESWDELWGMVNDFQHIATKPM